MINKRLVKIATIVLINFIIGFFIAKWVWVYVDFNLIIDESMSLDQTSLIISMFLGMFLYLLYGLRMALLLDINLLVSTQIVIMGFGLNAFLPFRLGDILKIIISKQFFKVDLTKTSFATVIEKGLDLTIIGSLALIFLFDIVKYSIPFFLISLVIWVLYIMVKSKLIPKINNKFVNKCISLIQVMLLQNKRKSIIFSTISIWVVTCIVFYVFFNFNITDGSFNYLDAIALLIFTTLSLSIPSMPAGIGIFESGIVFYLINHFHFTPEKAVAYAMIFHLLMILPQIVLTVIILFSNIIRSEKLGAVHNVV